MTSSRTRGRAQGDADEELFDAFWCPRHLRRFRVRMDVLGVRAPELSERGSRRHGEPPRRQRGPVRVHELRPARGAGESGHERQDPNGVRSGRQDLHVLLPQRSVHFVRAREGVLSRVVPAALGGQRRAGCFRRLASSFLFFFPSRQRTTAAAWGLPDHRTSLCDKEAPQEILWRAETFENGGE